MEKNTQIKLPEKEKNKISKIKGIFAGEDTRLKALRKSVLGLSLTDEDKREFKYITDDKEIVEYIKFLLNPSVTGDEDIFMVNDLWFQLQLKDKTVEEAKLLMNAVLVVENYLKEALTRLDGKDTSININDLKFSKDLDEDKNLANVVARNIIMSGVEGALRGIKSLAGEKGETIDELMERLKLNSSK